MPPPLFDTYDGEPTSVALRPLPLESVHVVPDVGAVCKLNCKPEVTIGVLQTKKLKLLVSEVPGLAPVAKLTICPEVDDQILKAWLENVHP
jgi:hypothetical protein